MNAKKLARLALLLPLFACGQPLRSAPTETGARKLSAPPSSPVASMAPLLGTECTTKALPTWTYEAAEHRIRLSDGGASFRLPSGWVARVEQPGLVVISSEADSSAVRPTFEVFVSPVCKTYDLPRVHERVASRAMAGLLSTAATAEQVRQGEWPAGLGGPVGRSIILFDVSLTTPRGKQILVLYGTDYGESKFVGVHAAAACPKQRAGDRVQTDCEKAYFEMLASGR